MKNILIGDVIFTLSNMDSEIRETYYTKTSDITYQLHGCIQGRSEDDRPRYINVDFEVGYEHTLIPTLPVFPIEKSIFSKFANFYPGTSMLK